MATASKPPSYDRGDTPAELLARPQWVDWKLEAPAKPRADGKLTKVPYDPKTGRKAKAGDPKTWASSEKAIAALNRRNSPYVGIGYELDIDDPYTGIDLDDCRNAETGTIADWGLIETLRFNSYTEVSPSGTGLRIFIKGRIGDAFLAPKQEGRKVGAYEAYSGKHFLTVTGNHLAGTPLEIHERQTELDAFCAEHFAPKQKTETAKTPRQELSRGDDDVVRLMCQHNPRAAALWAGDRSAHGSASEADEALIAHLDFWTGGDTDQIRRLFMASALYRPDEKHPHNPAGYVDICIESWQRDHPEAAHFGDDRPQPHPQTRPHIRLVTSDGEGERNASDMDALLLKGEADDNGNAEAMYRLFGRDYLYTPAYGWLAWTGTHWRDVPEAIVAQSAITTLKRRRHAAVEADREPIIKATKADRQRVMGCLTLFKSYVIEPSVSVFDTDPDLLNCQNGVLNLRTGALAPHDSKQRFTYCLPIAYDPDADMTAWRNFIFDALGRDKDAAHYIQLCVGYSLTGHTREEKLFYPYGPTRAGKGTFTETLLALLPHPLGTEVDFASFTARRDNDNQNFDLAELKPARLVVASESNRSQSLNPAKIKLMTGGNTIRCAFKHKDMFSYRPQFKLWLVSNHPVNGDPDDEALWGRVQVFTFPHSHLGAEDVTLKGKMKSPRNLQGVLRWAVEGAMQWYKQERLEAPASIVKATREQRDTQDYVKQWIGDCCTLNVDAWTSSAALTDSYQKWCEANSVKPLRANEFAETLVKRFSCVAKREAGTGTRGYKGIALGVTPDPDPESGVTPPEAASNQDYSPDTLEGCDTCDTRNGEVSRIRVENRKTPNQVSQVSRCHTPIRLADVEIQPGESIAAYTDRLEVFGFSTADTAAMYFNPARRSEIVERRNRGGITA